MLNLSCECRVGEMSRLHCSHLALDGASDQSEVADNIQKLVTGRFVVEIEFHIVQDTAFLNGYLRLLEEGRDVIEFLGGNVAVDEHDGVGQVATLDEVTADKSIACCSSKTLVLYFTFTSISKWSQGSILNSMPNTSFL